MNFTILSLSALNLNSYSPFYMASHAREHFQLFSLANSYFKYSFSPIIYSVHLQNFHFQDAKFFNTLSTAVVLDGLSCHINQDGPTKGVIQDKTIHPDGFSAWGGYRRATYDDDCGNIHFKNCFFDSCYAEEQGGGLYCQVVKSDQYSTTLTDCLFHNCRITQNGNVKGGAGAFIDSPTTRIVRTCCQNCYGNKDNNIVGSAMQLSSKDIEFTESGAFSNRPDDDNYMAHGAQLIFDRYYPSMNQYQETTSITCKHVNISDGKSHYNGGIEIIYPPLSSTTIQYITISKITASYLLVLKHCERGESYIFHHLNFFSNNLKNIDGASSALIFFLEPKQDGSGDYYSEISNMNLYNNNIDNGWVFLINSENLHIHISMNNCILDTGYSEYCNNGNVFAIETVDCRTLIENETPTFITFNWETGICNGLFFDVPEGGDSSENNGNEGDDSSENNGNEGGDSSENNGNEGDDSSENNGNEGDDSSENNGNEGGDSSENNGNEGDDSSENNGNDENNGNNSDPTDNEKPPDTNPGHPIGSVDNKGNGLPTGAIIGIIIACLVVLAVVIVLIVFAMKRNRAQSSQNLEPGENEMEEIPSLKSFESNTDPAIEEKLHSNKPKRDDPFDDDFHEVVDFFN